MTTTIEKNPAFEVYVESIRNGGGTFDAAGASPATGFAVSTAVLDASPVLMYADVAQLLARLTEGRYLGTWFDRENARWEISETAVIADRGDALTLARLLGERYVYDIAAGEEIAVPALSTASN